MFVILVLTLVYSVLPSNMVVFMKFTLVITRNCTLKVRITNFVLILVLFVTVLFLEFDSSGGLMLMFAPLSFKFDIPALLPVKDKLLYGTFSTLPTNYKIVVCCFVHFVHMRRGLLRGPSITVTSGLGLLASKVIRG